jgi:hypothetical protein
LVYSQPVVNSSPATPSTQAAKELANRPYSYEFVDFPIDKLAKAITKRKNTVNVKIGKQIDDTWTVEEHELNYNNLRLAKWDSDGSPLPGKPLCENYLATSENKQLNIRFTINRTGELSGFVHDLTANTMTHFRSVSLMTSYSGKEQEKNKLAIYTEKFQPPAGSITARNIDPACSDRWVVIAVEADHEVPSGILPAVRSQVEYVFYLNFYTNVRFLEKQWNQFEGGYPYNNLPQEAVNGTNPVQYRTSITELFNRFRTGGWSLGKPCHMMHLLSGRKLGTGAGPFGGDATNNQIDCGNGQVAASISSSEFLNESIEQVARVMAHELGHNLAATTGHDPGGSCVDENSYNASNPTPNTIMCTSFRVNSASNQLISARSPYFSGSFANTIRSNISGLPCLSPSPYLAFGQAYVNGNPIYSTPYFASSRNGTIAIDITSYYKPGYTVYPSFTPNVTPGSVYIGSVSVNGTAPFFSGSFYFGAPANVSNATFNVQASVNNCDTSVSRGIPVVFGSGYRIAPNPAQTNLTVELTLDKDTPNPADFMPESVVLVSEKNKELKRNEPKKNAANKLIAEPNKVSWDLADVEPGTYYVHLNYGNGVVFKERVIVQK